MSRLCDWSPLRDHNPVPGEPTEVADLARRFAQTAAAIEAAVTSLNKIDVVADVWDSDAGREFKKRTRSTADTIQKAFDRYHKASLALAAYGTALDQVQVDAVSATLAGRTAHDDLTSAQRQLQTAESAKPVDTALVSRLTGQISEAAGRLSAAELRMQAAERAWDDAGNAAAGTIENAATHDGLKDSWWDNFLQALKGIMKYVGQISAILGVLALAFCWVPIVGEVLAAMAYLAAFAALAGDTVLYLNGDGSLKDVLFDAVGCLSFGVGRAFTKAAEAVSAGSRGLAKPALFTAARAAGQTRAEARVAVRGIGSGGRNAVANRVRASAKTGWMPTGSEFKAGFNPLAGGARVRPWEIVTKVPSAARSNATVQAAMRRAAYARGTAAGVAVLPNNKAVHDTYHVYVPEPAVPPLVAKR